MAKKPDPFMVDDENSEWTEADTEAAWPFGEVFPEQLAALKKREPPPRANRRRVE